MRDLKLNEERQKALLKRVLTNPDSIVSTQMRGSVRRIVARYTYRGVYFEAQAELRQRAIHVLRVTILG
jgi:hypothetical protein